VSTLVLADSKSDYAPSWYDSPSGKNILHNFIDTLNPFSGSDANSMQNSADIYGWYNGTFFTVYEWERQVCSMDLSSTVTNLKDSITNSEDLEQFYTTTLSVSAVRTEMWNTTYYEVSWYVMPYTSDSVSYNVYLTDGSNKEYFAGNSADSFKTASRQSGDSGYTVKYLSSLYDKVIMEYKFPDSDELLSLESSVVTR
jgi:hypothetical protein